MCVFCKVLVVLFCVVLSRASQAVHGCPYSCHARFLGILRLYLWNDIISTSTLLPYAGNAQLYTWFIYCSQTEWISGNFMLWLNSLCNFLSLIKSNQIVEIYSVVIVLVRYMPLNTTVVWHWHTGTIQLMRRTDRSLIWAVKIKTINSLEVVWEISLTEIFGTHCTPVSVSPTGALTYLYINCCSAVISLFIALICTVLNRWRRCKLLSAPTYSYNSVHV